MLKYSVSYAHPEQKIIEIQLITTSQPGIPTTFQLPAWRPGRYELQNYARNIVKFQAFNTKTGASLAWKKTHRENWQVSASEADEIKIVYTYYASQMDAGGSWIDDEQLYINFINCMMYPIGKEKEACEVTLNIPDNYKIACGLKNEGKKLYADNFLHLSDSPLIASPYLQLKTYHVENIPFHIWILGQVSPNWDKLISDFTRFTKEQLAVMGDFPEKDYHFLFEFLPYKQHHGVEHRNSTIITLGPSEAFHSDNFYHEFLSISSHELFHTWNIAKIRPVEMMPYDLTKENYFTTGFVAEGITTYYGEYFLARAGVFTQDQYFHELNSQLKRHFENFGNFNLSLADSSFDLWVDGYTQGVPNRKVSIYTKGCILALIVDLEIRRATGNQKSLDDVMRVLWEDFGKKEKGYSLDDFSSIVEQIAGSSLLPILEEAVFGTTDLKQSLENALSFIGCELSITDSRYSTERNFGFKISQKDGKTTVEQIEPGSPAERLLSKDDEIIAVDKLKVYNNLNDLLAHKKKVEITLFRKHKLQTIVLETTSNTFFKNYKIVKSNKASKEQMDNFRCWLKHAF
ncbi:MAG TPA: M61 family peptidase [Cytophagaceae bacterium]